METSTPTLPPPIAEAKVIRRSDGRPAKNPKHPALGKTASPLQKAALQKGFEALKKKREELAKEKEEKKKVAEERKAAGLPPIEEPPKIKAVQLPPIKVEEVKVPEVKVRKQRSDTGIKRKESPAHPKAITREEFNEIRELIKSHTKPIETERIVEKEVVREVPVVSEKVVEKEKILTGSALLNKVFFNR